MGSVERKRLEDGSELISIAFTVHGEPMGKQRPRFAVTDTGARIAYTSDATAAYETSVKWAFPVKNEIPFTTEGVTIEIRAFYAIPASAKKSEKLMMATELVPVRKKPDFDNVAKIICDALNGMAWKDDSQVTDAIIRKRYSLNPRVELKIYGVKKKG